MVRHHPGFLIAWEPEADVRIVPQAVGWAGVWPLEWSSRFAVGRAPDLSWIFAADGPDHPLQVILAEDQREGVVLFHGVLYERTQKESLASEMLSAAAQGSIERELRRLSGTFCGAVFHRRRRALLLFTDGYGTERLYYARRPNGWAAATDPFVLARWCGATHISTLALGSQAYAGFLVSGSLFEGQQRVHAGCFIRCDETLSKESEWMDEPEPRMSGRSAVEALDEAHRRFWKGPLRTYADEVALLLSRGKDSRIILKYMLDAGIRPRIATYERRDDSFYPFVTYLLRDTTDGQTARSIASWLGLPFQSLCIPVQYALEHTEEIVALNHGMPLHWELLAVAEAVHPECRLLINGFEGDVVANLHAVNAETKVSAADRLLRQLGAAPAYERLRAVMQDDEVGFVLPDLKDLQAEIRAVFDLALTSDSNAVARRGFIRVQGAGRNVPTFHQARRYRIPVYPYLDRSLREAYGALSRSALTGKWAHFALLAQDHRLCRWPVSRSGLSARHEWQLITMTRPGLRWYKKRVTTQDRAETPRPDVDVALERTGRDLGLAPAVWRRWSEAPRPAGYYATTKNLFDCIRARTFVARLISARAQERIATLRRAEKL